MRLPTASTRSKVTLRPNRVAAELDAVQMACERIDGPPPASDPFLNLLSNVATAQQPIPWLLTRHD
ncbi:BQ5605_C022g09457 [Microbotryum silenes-dioicae]|uniref:BQ5605_C022g09457 protein n=1 Tax=Microbotryum silenes-dioicae TaxID=796604 RepID=A0A2X0PKA0_9BASI|nr:BQ5605_C022g09457 [Microbotryum silenes-dioicae]